MQKNMKKGISMVVLIVTMVISMVLISVTVVSIKSAVDNAALLTFAQDLSSVQEATENYLLRNDEVPFLGSKQSLTQDEILNASSSGDVAKEKLTEELKLNGDYNENGFLGSFYQVDLAKLGFEKSARGTKSKGENDVYVVSYPSMNIYYLKGIKANSDMFFSLSSKLIQVTKITKKDTSGEVQTQNVAGITTKKSIKTWTNKMGISVTASMNAGEVLQIRIPEISGGRTININTVVGSNQFTFDNLVELKTISNITDADDTAFKALPQDKKYIEVVKKISETILGSIKLDLSNYETIPPIETKPIQVNSTFTDNTVELGILDGLSGIKEVRYEYLRKFNEVGIVQEYYRGITSFDENYMKARSKKADFSKDGNINIKVPKDIEGIQIMIFDRAGNWINKTQKTDTGIYVGFNPKEINLTTARFSLVLNSPNGISSVSTLISTDGINYIDAKTFNLNNNLPLNRLDVNDYSSITGANNKIYVKVLATNNATVENRKQEIRVVELTKDENPKNIGVNEPVIPLGFDVKPIMWDNLNNELDVHNLKSSWYNYEVQSGSTENGGTSRWANIKAKDGSYFVWIPRYAYKINTGYHTGGVDENVSGQVEIKFLKNTTNEFWDGTGVAETDSSKITYTEGAQNEWLVHPAFNFGAESKSGLWVAKFEASRSNAQVISKGDMFAPNAGSTNIVKSVPNVTSFRNITISQMSDACIQMQNNTSVYGWVNTNTHLMKSSEWGAVAYLTHSKYGRNGSQVNINSNQNHITGIGSNSPSSTANLETTLMYNTDQGMLSSTTGNISGIYDISGGAEEAVLGHIGEYLGNSGFSQEYVNNNSRYFDIYSKGTNDNDAQSTYVANAYKKGDAIYETSSNSYTLNYQNSWFRDYSEYVKINTPFFSRGGNSNKGAGAGIFAFSAQTGSAVENLSFRPVLSE